jgi:hypothetical protein
MEASGLELDIPVKIGECCTLTYVTVLFLLVESTAQRLKSDKGLFNPAVQGDETK